jgi:hypothetical protein
MIKKPNKKSSLLEILKARITINIRLPRLERKSKPHPTRTTPNLGCNLPSITLRAFEIKINMRIQLFLRRILTIIERYKFFFFLFSHLLQQFPLQNLMSVINFFKSFNITSFFIRMMLLRQIFIRLINYG